MKNLNRNIFLAAGISLVSACSTVEHVSEAKPFSQSCLFADSQEEAPEWVCTGNLEGLVSGRGSYDRSNASENLAFQIAQQRARADLARKLALDLKTSLNDYESVTGSELSERIEQHVQAISKSELEMPLEGSRVYASVTGPDGTMYVLVGLDEDMAKKNKRRFIKSSFRDAEARWTKNEAEQAYRQLDELLTNNPR